MRLKVTELIPFDNDLGISNETRLIINHVLRGYRNEMPVWAQEHFGMETFFEVRQWEAEKEVRDNCFKEWNWMHPEEPYWHWMDEAAQLVCQRQRERHDFKMWLWEEIDRVVNPDKYLPYFISRSMTE